MYLCGRFHGRARRIDQSLGDVGSRATYPHGQGYTNPLYYPSRTLLPYGHGRFSWKLQNPHVQNLVSRWAVAASWSFCKPPVFRHTCPSPNARCAARRSRSGSDSSECTTEGIVYIVRFILPQNVMNRAQSECVNLLSSNRLTGNDCRMWAANWKQNHSA